MIYVCNSAIATELYSDLWTLWKLHFLQTPDAPTANKRVYRRHNVTPPMLNWVNTIFIVGLQTYVSCNIIFYSHWSEVTIMLTSFTQCIFDCSFLKSIKFSFNITSTIYFYWMSLNFFGSMSQYCSKKISSTFALIF